MRQDVSLNLGEDKNSCAEANAYAENPIDLNNRVVAVRTEASSSTIEITGICATRPDLFRGVPTKVAPDMSPPRISYGRILPGRIILRFRNHPALSSNSGRPARPES